MVRHEEARKTLSFTDRRPHAAADEAWGSPEPRTIVIRQGSAWQSLAFLLLCLLLIAAVLLGHYVVRDLDRKSQETSAAVARAERKMQRLESGLTFEARRRQMLLGMRDHILKANSKVSLADAYRYAELALAACEKYPAVDPLLLLAVGLVESGYDPMARSRADARGLYQIWPSTGRLLVRALGWSYDAQVLYDPEKNTQAAALYLDILFATYSDPQMVLAEYNGGPLNAGYLRAGASALADETRSYVPRVLELHKRLHDEFETGAEIQAEPARQDSGRQGKTLVPR
jgi:soluble lytic murein transglycosylase-like protein